MIDALAGALEVSNFARGEVLFRQAAANGARRILLAGAAKITCHNAAHARLTVDLIAPGLLPELPALMASVHHSDFRCEAYYNCRVGILDRRAVDDSFVADSHQPIRAKFIENDLLHWTRMLRRTSEIFTNLDERIVITMLDLCDDFGLQRSRGVLVTVPISQEDLASLVGASCFRIVKHLERNHLLMHQGNRFVVNQKALLKWRNATN